MGEPSKGFSERGGHPDGSIAHEGFFATHFFTVRDQDKSQDFCVRILTGRYRGANDLIRRMDSWLERRRRRESWEGTRAG